MSQAKVNDETWEFWGMESAVRLLGSEPDITGGLPRKWRVFGPVGPESTRIFAYGEGLVQRAEPTVSADIDKLTSIPERLTIGAETFEGVDVEMEQDTIDFDALFGGHNETLGRQAYAMAEVSFDNPTEVIIGAGSNWWFQFWVDGEEVFNSLASGNTRNHRLEISPVDYCHRYRFDAGKHLLVVRSISGLRGKWVLRGCFASAKEELLGSREMDRWEMMPDLNKMLPPRGTNETTMALRTDRCVEDETIACDFILNSPECQFGIVFGAQDADHYYWAYYPRWGQNWRARAFYAVIAKVEGNGHARGLGMMLMPNVPTHWNARLSMKVQRRGDHIQMYVNGVKGPFVIDDTYGAGYAGVLGHTDYEVENFKLDGRDVGGRTWRAQGQSEGMWLNPIKDTGYGNLRHPFTLLRLTSGEILASVYSHQGQFHGPADPNAQVNLCLSDDAGRTWRPHGDPQPAGNIPPNQLWGIRWFEPQPGVIRAFNHGAAVRAQRETLDGCSDEDVLTFRDSNDTALTWSSPRPAKLVGDWSNLYRPGSWNHIYGFTQLRDGTLLLVMLHGLEMLKHKNLEEQIPNAGEGTWGTELAQPYVSRSEDGGLTWQTPVPMDNAALYDGQEPESPNGGFSETVLAELPTTGRIVVTCRVYHSPFSWLTHSDDGGRTWRLACYAPFSVSGGPQMVATQSGYLAVVARQTGLGMHTSVDGGINWDAGTLLDHDCWFNGFLTEAEADVVLVFYYSPTPGGRSPANPRMQRIRITPDGPVPADL